MKMLLQVLVLAMVLAAVNAVGEIEDTKCSAPTVRAANSYHLNCILRELSNTTFFRLARIDMTPATNCFATTTDHQDTACSAPPEDFGIYATGALSGGGEQHTACSLDLTESEFGDKSSSNHHQHSMSYFELSSSSAVETHISHQEYSALKPTEEFPGPEACASSPTFWQDLCAEMDHGTPLVNLVLNPERNTGYNGSKVWEDIYKELEYEVATPEGKFLKRIISGWHSSISLHIAKEFKFHPHQGWVSSRNKFFETFGAHPDRLENLHFSLLVVLRALFKARDVLQTFDYKVQTEHNEENVHTNEVMGHLLDSHVLSLCAPLFHGFDETVLFKNDHLTGSKALASPSSAQRLKDTFKQIQKLVNCRVTCQRCLLHSKVALRGIASAVKIIAANTTTTTTRDFITRDDLVALINTASAFSDALVYAEEFMAQSDADLALRVVASIPPEAFPNAEAEVVLVAAILGNDADILALARTIGLLDPPRFLRLALNRLKFEVSTTSPAIVDPFSADLVVVGGGLAGMASAVAAADRGATVILFEKERSVGGNTAKASSGINQAVDVGDESVFLQDTIKSAGGHGSVECEHTLVNRSISTVGWLRERFQLSLNEVGILGGHSVPRTYRPAEGLVGAEIVAALGREVRLHPNIRVFTSSPVTDILKDAQGRVVGVSVNGTVQYKAAAVALTSGGFGFFSSLLKRFRPDLISSPTTLGPQTTGDGIELAEKLGAGLVDMEYVQIHPTGFVDPKDPTNRVKVLAAEILRGVGGLLVHPVTHKRFCNELGTRKYVVDEMQKHGSEWYYLILSEDMLSQAPIHKKVYLNKNILDQVTSRELLDNIIDLEDMERYNDLATVDAFGKKLRPGAPLNLSADAAWFVGKVTPVIHFTMGGVSMDAFARVLDQNKQVIPGLYAAGEVSGGVHGVNRLGGNSLLECAVFGKLIGESVSVSNTNVKKAATSSKVTATKTELFFTMEEVSQHKTADDCWLVLYDDVYDLSGYAQEHPGGADSIERVCGKNGTDEFSAVHTKSLLNSAGFMPSGKVKSD